MPKITVDESLLIEAFNALECEQHSPNPNSDCDACVVMDRIENALGRQLTVFRGEDILELIVRDGKVVGALRDG